uniref:SOSEKI DIX-like domain-containing protein n=1 Tax=Physcomitrium patens TaxID=3218 RepID=A0A7I4EGZ2_PHYPA
METHPEFYHKVEVLYILIQGNEQIGHPHMIQVQYPSHQQAPTLRDVKCRLTALRGRGMPDLYSWSYKRSYKGNFIWCDVFDNDVILPLSGSGEYVLKALEVFEVSLDALDQEVAVHQVAAQSAMRTLPRNRCRGTDQSPMQEQHLTEMHIIGNVCNTISSILESKHDLLSDSGLNNIATKVFSNYHIDIYNCGRPAFVSGDLIENNNAFEKIKVSDSSTCKCVSNGNEGILAEPCDTSSNFISGMLSSHKDAKMEAKELPVGLMMVSSDHSEKCSFVVPAAGFSGRESTKRRTWAVKKQDNSMTIDGRTSRRSSQDDRVPTMSTRDSPSTSIARPCLPVHPFTFMVKKAIRFRRTQLCTKVEVVERFRTVPIEELSFLRPTSKSQHGIGSKKASPKPRYSKAETENSKLQRRGEMTVGGQQGEVRSLSDVLETTRSGCNSQKMDKESVRKTESARQVVNFDANTTARCREVDVVCETVLLPERVSGKDQKAVSDLNSNQLLLKPDTKSFKAVTKPAVQHPSKHGDEQSSASFNQGFAHTHHLPKAFRRQGATVEMDLKQQKSLFPVLIGAAATNKTSFASNDSVLTNQNLKALKFPRKVKKNFHNSFPVPGSEKRFSDTKVYPSRESSVFDSAALHDDILQDVNMVNPKEELKVQMPPAATSSPDEESMSSTTAPVKQDFKHREERPLTPGLTEMHWENLLQKTDFLSQPPQDLVLHECL